jgi:hypothetical protein
MPKTKIWYTKNEGDIQVRQMETSHIEHCLRKILPLRSRNGKIFRWRGRYLGPLQRELDRRRINALLDWVSNPTR